LCIGIDTAAFTLYEAVALKPIAARAPRELMRISGSRNGIAFDTFSASQYRQIAFQMGSAASVIATSGTHAIEARMPQPAVLHVRFVSENYFDTLGVGAQIGRTFAPGDVLAAVLSDGFWRKLNRDPRALSRQIHMQGAALDIVGVAPRNFAGAGNPPQMPDLWIPFAAQPSVLPGMDWRQDDTVREFQLLGRRRKEVTLAQASAQLDVLAGTWPPVNGKPAHLAARPATFFQMDSGEFQVFGTVSAILMSAVALILIVGALNLVNLFLARHAAREREFAVRLAMGASRLHLVRQLCMESALVGILAGAAGLLFSLWLCDWIRGAIGGTMERISGGALGVYLDVIPDWRIFCYTLAVSLTTGIAIGIWPAMRASRGDPVAALKPGSAGSIRGRHSRSKRNLALTAQVAACLTLLAGAGLLFRGAWSGSGVSPAFETRHLMVVSFDPTTEARDMLLRQSVQRLEEMPEVAAVAWAAGPPFLGHGSGEFRNQRGSSFTSPFNLVSAGYFDTLGLRLVAGRGFTAEEAETAAPVAVIDESLARRAWPGRNAVGRKIRLGERTEFMHASATVIGVVRNLRGRYLSKPDSGYLYLPQPLSSPPGILLVRTRPMPERAFHSILAALAKVDANLPSQTYLTTLESGPMEAQRLMAKALAAAASILGGLALLLAGVGVFGLVAQLVAQRRREIAIRVAQGAQPFDVLRWAMRQTLSPVILGGAIGTAGAVVMAVLSAQAATGLPDLTDGAGTSPAVCLSAALAILAATVAAAGFPPLLRAANVEPADALRNQ
jgi:predicted permease